MSSENIQKLREQILEEETSDFNREAVAELMQEWVINISENISLMRRTKNLTESRMYGKMAKPGSKNADTAIVVAAAPELTDEDLIKLRDFKGDVICCNKNFKRMVDLGRIPEWVCLLDAHPISHKQFDWMNESPYSGDIARDGVMRPKFFVASVVYPPTLRTIMEFTDQVYGFNPVDDSSKGTVRLSKTWEWMNDKMEFDHGGSVGGCAVNLAASLYYKKIGLLGFGMWESPNPNWSIDEAKQREYIYYPDVNQVCAIPRHFKFYISHILWTAQNTSWAEWYNLSNSPLFKHSPVLKQASVEEFIKENEK